MKKLSIKRASWILIILLLLFFAFTATACMFDDWKIRYNGMSFQRDVYKTEDGKEYYYYAAGYLSDKNVQNYFIPMEIDGIPVLKFGIAGLITNNSTNLKEHALQKLYMPGSIIEQYVDEEYLYSVHQNMQVYYCGNIIDLYWVDLYTSMIDYFVPAEKFDDFQNALGTQTQLHPAAGLYKANIAYRLNAEDMCEYYYVDNIEAGSKIENIPPEPKRAGYKFAGWYTEKECINAWNFNNIPTVSIDEESFVEFSLYAKWTKK